MFKFFSCFILNIFTNSYIHTLTDSSIHSSIDPSIHPQVWWGQVLYHSWWSWAACPCVSSPSGLRAVRLTRPHCLVTLPWMKHRHLETLPSVRCFWEKKYLKTTLYPAKISVWVLFVKKNSHPYYCYDTEDMRGWGKWRSMIIRQTFFTGVIFYNISYRVNVPVDHTIFSWLHTQAWHPNRRYPLPPLPHRPCHAQPNSFSATRHDEYVMIFYKIYKMLGNS